MANLPSIRKLHFVQTSALALVGFGDDRLAEAIKLAGLSVVMAGIALSGMLFDGYLTTAEEFSDYIWLSAADIIGTVVGATLAIAAFAIVIWSYEKIIATTNEFSSSY